MVDDHPAEIAAYLDVTTEVPPGGVDVLFIPGTRHTEPARIAARMLDQQVAPIAVLTGGINHVTGMRESREHYRLLLEHGIAADRLIIEDQSTNTLENVTLSLPLLRERSTRINSVLAICKWMHSRRVLMTLKRNWPPGIRYYAETYAPHGVTPTNWHSNPAASTVTHNWDCIPRYLAAGHLAELTPDGDAYV